MAYRTVLAQGAWLRKAAVLDRIALLIEEMEDRYDLIKSRQGIAPSAPDAEITSEGTTSTPTCDPPWPLCGRPACGWSFRSHMVNEPAPAGDEDDVIAFAEQEMDRTCRAGEEGWSVGDGRPLRDLDQPTGGFTLPRTPVQRSRDPTSLPLLRKLSRAPEFTKPIWRVVPLPRRDARRGSSGCVRAAVG